MKLWGIILGATLFWHIAIAGKKTFNEDGTIKTETPGVESSYPEEIEIPNREDGSGPASHPFPAPVVFKKAELLAAYKQAQSQSKDANRRSPYPKKWLGNDGSKKSTGVMEFPILKGGLWNGGSPGEYRFLYKHADGSFYGVSVHAADEDANSGERYTLCSYGPWVNQQGQDGPSGNSRRNPTSLKSREIVCKRCTSQKRGGTAAAAPKCKVIQSDSSKAARGVNNNKY